MSLVKITADGNKVFLKYCSIRKKKKKKKHQTTKHIKTAKQKNY